MRELQGVPGDVRHSIINSITVVHGIVIRMSLPGKSEVQRDGVLALIREAKNVHHLYLLQWAVNQLMLEGRLEASVGSPYMMILQLMSDKSISRDAFFRMIDGVDIDSINNRLVPLVSGVDMPFRIFSVD
ncbi:MAG: hypothetical protein HC902_09685 [Calothrix sp. SM1_5_4]|nr:hypothetical protein [Calothrix sp. SM1_5_4]